MPPGPQGGGLLSVLIATRNAGKLHELGPMIEAAGLHAMSLDGLALDPVPEEDALEAFETFEENALAKARWFHRVVGASRATAVLGDDSGLAVDALGGAPGVRSKRYSGSALHGHALDDENNRVLLGALSGERNRRARFVCAAALVWRGGELVARGETAGTVVDVPRGRHGFGYDPHFLSDDLGITLAEATREEKAGVSHRARAVRAVLAKYLAVLAREGR
jgi:XTP/dITP diphosphohydrolase